MQLGEIERLAQESLLVERHVAAQPNSPLVPGDGRVVVQPPVVQGVELAHGQAERTQRLVVDADQFFDIAYRSHVFGDGDLSDSICQYIPMIAHHIFKFEPNYIGASGARLADENEEVVIASETPRPPALFGGKQSRTINNISHITPFLRDVHLAQPQQVTSTSLARLALRLPQATHVFGLSLNDDSLQVVDEQGLFGDFRVSLKPDRADKTLLTTNYELQTSEETIYDLRRKIENRQKEAIKSLPINLTVPQNIGIRIDDFAQFEGEELEFSDGFTDLHTQS